MPGHKGYLALLEEMKTLHLQKAADYGSNEDPLQNLRGSADIGIPPWKGAWLRAKDKVKRIDQFCRKGELMNEGVEDSLKDLAAYCLLALTLMREENNQGKPIGQELVDDNIPIAAELPVSQDPRNSTPPSQRTMRS